jgi:2-keto-4-pentenoate hydratase/2-oxohepta-3-ene-1,7-dioic acid hydratase in catechol pathway
MRLVTFGPPKAEQPGVLGDDGTILPLAALLEDYGLQPGDMLGVVGSLEFLQPVIEKELATGEGRISAEGLRLGPPIPRPRKVMVIGGNYWSHVEEQKHLSGAEPPSPPIIVIKPATNVIGPNDPVIRPHQTTQLDYEAELGVVVGRGGRRISRENAYDHIAGYMNLDDTGAREVMMGEMKKNPMFGQPTRGKGFDSFCPCGPHLVTKDEVPDPMKLTIRKWVNGDLRQEEGTDDMVVDIPGLIADASSVFRLLPGDIFLTGTPAGGGGNMKPQVFLQPGDVIRQEISNDQVSLGVMENIVEDEAGRPS